MAPRADHARPHLPAGRLRRLLPPAVAFFVGSGLSVVAFALMWQLTSQRLASDFNQHAGNLYQVLRTGIHRKLETVFDLRDLYGSSREVEQDEFRRFAASLLARHSGIQLLLWAAPQPQASTSPAAGGAAATPIVFIEPAARCRGAVGFDLAADPHVGGALQRACQTGEATLVHCRDLAGCVGDGAECLVFLPFYGSAEVTPDPAERRRRLVGYVAAGFDFDDLVYTLYEGVDLGGVDVFVQTPWRTQPQHVVFERDGRVIASPDPESLGRIGSGLHVQRSLDVGDALIETDFVPSDAFTRGYNFWAVWLVLGTGMLATTALSVYLWTFAGRAEQSRRWAAEQQRINEELHRQITVRQAAEEALRETQRAQSTLMSNLPGMAYRCANDPDWTMEFVSGGSLALTGYRPEELVNNRDVSFGDIIVPEDRPMVWQDVQDALEMRRPYRLTYRIRTKDGTVRWVWEQGSGVFNPRGELAALEGFINDISEQRRLLDQAQDDAEHRKVLLGELNHRVKNNLATIASLLYLERTRPTQDKQAFIDSCLRRVESLSELHAILSWQTTEHVSVHRLIHRVVGATVSGSHPPHPELEVETPGPDPTIPPDLASGLAMATSELVSNALRHGRPQTGRPRLLVRLSTTNHFCQLEVTDNGPGLPEGFSIRRDGGTGMNLVWFIATQQLHGRIHFTRRNDGHAAVLVFPLPPESP